MEKVGVQLGRFAPYHKGHQMVTEQVLERFGPQNTVIMVGSSNAFNDRTPFTFEQRRALIKKLVPEAVRVIGLPDIDPCLRVHGESTIPAWLDQIESIQNEMDVEFVFCGGSEDDLRFFPGRFESEVVVDRETLGKGISATEIRKLIAEAAFEELKAVMDERIVPDAVRFFEANQKELN